MEKIKAYKGFDSDLKCRGFQFEEGKEYEEKGEIKACEKGFHACEEPLNVFDYYSPIGDNGKINEFREVECFGEINKDGNDSKLACSKIKIGGKISFLGLANLQIEYVKSKTDKAKEQTILKDSSVASNSGDRSVAVAWGIENKAKAKKGSYIALSEWIYNNKKDEYILKTAKMKKVDGKAIKADTFYTLKDGRFTEV